MGAYGSKDQHPRLTGSDSENDRIASLKWRYCPKCGHKHLEQYKACPACGYVHKKGGGAIKTFWICASIIIGIVLIGVYGGADTPTSSGPSRTDNYAAPPTIPSTASAPPKNNADIQTTVPVETAPQMTMGQRNALKSAKNYLSFTSFSYTGLIEQLEFEHYTHEEAVFAADNCGADWYDQAVKKAESYLDLLAFSKEGLVHQLEFEGFTSDQANYAVEKIGYQ